MFVSTFLDIDVEQFDSYVLNTNSCIFSEQCADSLIRLLIGLIY